MQQTWPRLWRKEKLLQIASDEAMESKLTELMLKNDHRRQQHFMGTTHCDDAIESFLDNLTFSVAWLGSKTLKIIQVKFTTLLFTLRTVLTEKLRRSGLEDLKSQLISIIRGRSWEFKI